MDVNVKMQLIQDFIKQKEFILGPKDSGFAILVLTEFLEWLEENNIELT